MDIIINDISKKFTDKIVLEKFSAVIHENKVTGIMGPSGCGKTTLLNLLMGLLTLDSGTITGIPARKSAVFQEDRLCESFSAIDNVHMVCKKGLSVDVVKEHLTKIGIGDSMYKPVKELSGGMRRRVAIVRAILREAAIYYLDEPFKGLDATTKSMVMEYVKTQLHGKTILMVTHDEIEANVMCDEMIRMESNRL